MGLGIFIPIGVTVIIILGPLIPAIERKDWNEILVDVVIVGCFWISYFLLSGIDINDILNRAFN